MLSTRLFHKPSRMFGAAVAVVVVVVSACGGSGISSVGPDGTAAESTVESGQAPPVTVQLGTIPPPTNAVSAIGLPIIGDDDPRCAFGFTATASLKSVVGSVKPPPGTSGRNPASSMSPRAAQI